jgi:hypothetical protein
LSSSYRVGDPAASFNARRFVDRHLGTNGLYLDGRVQRFVTSFLDSHQQHDSAGRPDPKCVWGTGS